MAVTLHYCAEDGNDLVVRSRLGAFRHIIDRHTGKSLAEHFVIILKELGILHKVCRNLFLLFPTLILHYLGRLYHPRQCIKL